MAFRGTESPMDFEWQGYGPIDVSSPFHKHAMESSKKRQYASSTLDASIHGLLGTHAQFDSPAKSNLPSLDEPNGKPWFFANAPTPAPAQSPFRAPSFTTPRKPFDVDFSSPPESSPAELADNEDTPEAKQFEFTSGSVKPSTKRNSLFGMYGKFAPSPGRMAKPYNDALERRIHKRRRRAQNFDNQLVVARRASDDTSSGDDVGIVAKAGQPYLRNLPQNQNHQAQQKDSWLRSSFTFLTTFPDAPAIIAKYLQIFFNFVIFSSIFYIFYSFYATIQADVDRASDDAMAEVLSEMAQCSKNYVENQCGADARLPALETICSNWELCMNRDPAAVKRGRLSAHTFAEILNSFVEPISLKTMAFASTLVILSIIVNNVTFTLYRRQYEQHHHSAQASNSHQNLSAAGYGQHPALHMGHMGQFAASPGMPYPAQVGWHDNQRRLDYGVSPTKSHSGRGRSRSPEKR